jgi:hypothetical protein
VPDAPDAVRELADHVITRTERLLNYENCDSEGITEALEKAQDVHLAACEAGTPGLEAPAQRLATGALETGWGVSRDGPAKYVGVLGAAGLARYRELLTNAPARQHEQDACRPRARNGSRPIVIGWAGSYGKVFVWKSHRRRFRLRSGPGLRRASGTASHTRRCRWPAN